MESSPPLQFNASDFQSFSWTFRVNNLTSKRPVEPSALIQVVQIGERGFTLIFPPRSCAVGHQLEINAELSLPATPENIAEGPVKIEGTARVEHVEKQDEVEDLVEITFQQIDETAWARVHAVMNARQTAILDFFRSVKGEE